jgi:hypothetical protein
MVMTPTWCRVFLLGMAMAVLAGCASRDAGFDTRLPMPAARVGLLTVHVGLFGGPPRRGGGMALSNAPEASAPVSLTADSGRTWSAKTDRSGLTRFAVPADRYTVSSSFCGAPQHVTIVAGKRAYVQLACAIP